MPSLPVLAVGGAALGVAALSGSRLSGRSVEKARDRLSEHIMGAVDVQAMRYGFHDTVFQLSAQGTLAQDLDKIDVRGPDYLQHISEEEDEPLLIIRSPG